MRCLYPRSVGFKADGKTILWSPRLISKEYPTFVLPCGKCIECRLEYARSWAVRCVHEAQMHERNSFITLTYENLTTTKLVYRDFQLFMKKLRKTQRDPIGVFVTGEYGDKNKRPHWHAILFNWRPRDLVYVRVNENQDRIYNSECLSKLWGLGFTEVGDVTFKSAGYCARYAAKKLVHGPDGHEYEPISRKSSKHAIGKRFLERYWRDIFNHGECILFDGTSVPIPRYYEKWFRENHFESWLCYVRDVKPKLIEFAERRTAKEREIFLDYLYDRRDRGDMSDPISKREVRIKLAAERFKRLQSFNKL